MKNKINENFKPSWEPSLVSEEIVATGTWWYQDKISYDAKLIKQKYDYGSKDLVILEQILEVPFIDYIDYSISDEGILYFWSFSNETYSDTFGNYYSAREHIDSYDGRNEIEWLTE